MTRECDQGDYEGRGEEIEGQWLLRGRTWEYGHELDRNR